MDDSPSASGLRVVSDGELAPHKLQRLQAWVDGLAPATRAEIDRAAADGLITGMGPLASALRHKHEARLQARTEQAITLLFAKRRGLASLGIGVACYPLPIDEPEPNRVLAVDRKLGTFTMAWPLDFGGAS